MRTTAILLVLCLAGAYGQKGGIQGQSQIGGGGGGIGIGGGGGGVGSEGNVGMGGSGGSGMIGGGGEGGIPGGGVGGSISNGIGGISGGGGGIGGISGGGGGISGGSGGISSGGSIEGLIGGGQQGGLDLFTLLTRQVILAYGMDPLMLPNLDLPFQGILGRSGTVHTYNTLVFGLSHVRRTGPCFVTVDDSGMRLGLDLGIQNVIANSSATLSFKSRRMSKTKVQVMATVKNARAVILISQTGPHEIHVKDFKMVTLDGFKLYIRPQGRVSPLVRPFLGAARKFLEMAVHRRLEKMVRNAVDQQIKKMLFFLQRQAQSRPQPQLPSFPSDSGISGGTGGGIGGGQIGGPGGGQIGGPTGGQIGGPGGGISGGIGGGSIGLPSGGIGGGGPGGIGGDIGGGIGGGPGGTSGGAGGDMQQGTIGIKTA